MTHSRTGGNTRAEKIEEDFKNQCTRRDFSQLYSAVNIFSLFSWIFGNNRMLLGKNLYFDWGIEKKRIEQLSFHSCSEPRTRLQSVFISRTNPKPKSKTNHTSESRAIYHHFHYQIWPWTSTVKLK